MTASGSDTTLGFAGVSLTLTGTANAGDTFSVSNVARAYRHLDGYGTVRCHLDNDEAGRRTLEALRTRYGERVSDCSGIYGGCKDLNEYLQSRLKQNEKNNKNIKLKM